MCRTFFPFLMHMNASAHTHIRTATNRRDVNAPWRLQVSSLGKEECAELKLIFT